MKILLFLLAFLLLACSTEDPVEPELVESTLYYLTLAPECNLTNAKDHQVTEDMHKSVTDAHDVGDCEDYQYFKDIDGVLQEGYFMGEYILFIN